MKTLEADFKIVTPLFMSGADQAIAEIRAPSIKGVIRFWWRALAYSRFKGDLVALAKGEEELFGSTERGASIIIRVSSNPRIAKITPKNTVHQSFGNVAGARYLGYGLMVAFGDDAGKLQRPCINHNQQLTVTFIAKNDIPKDFIDAVKLMGLLGGLGSRSRKGFGSLTLEKLSEDKQITWTKSADKKTYKLALDGLLNGINIITDEPPFSAFSSHTRIDCLKQGSDPIRLLETFGRQMQRYRSWGHRGRVNGEASEQNFQPDHDWFKNEGNYRQEDFHPQRVVFGLPHNYGKYADGSVAGVLHDRRSSPLLVHVHEFAEGSYGLVSLVLRAKFLPDIEDGGKPKEPEKIKAGGKAVSQNIEWKLIDEFLDGYEGHKDGKTNRQYFPDKKPWLGIMS